jgi:hypothetical protein
MRFDRRNDNLIKRTSLRFDPEIYASTPAETALLLYKRLSYSMLSNYDFLAALDLLNTMAVGEQIGQCVIA